MSGFRVRSSGSGDRRASASPGAVPGFLFVLTLVAIALAIALRTRIREPLDLPDARSPLVSWPDMRIDVNQAGPGELTALPGIGPRLAERIVEDRTAHGPFVSIDDVARVHRVGPALVSRMRPHAVADSADGE